MNGRRIGRIFGMLLLSAALLGAPAYSASSETAAAETRTFHYEEDTSLFPNPERGWYNIAEVDAVRASSMTSNKTEEGVSLLLMEADLGEFVNSDDISDKIARIENAFDAARSAGYSVIFRAGYTFEKIENPEPEDLGRILGHIAQLEDVFRDNEDILFAVQAGFLGPWGEWHSSYYGDPIRDDVQKDVVDALLDVVPESVTIQLRRPVFVRTVNGGATLTAEEAFGTSLLARVGYHNDAILSTEDDYGTYSDENYTRQQELDWTSNHTRYTPFIGETGVVTEYSDMDNALELLDMMNIQSMSNSTWSGVMKKWKDIDYDDQMSFYGYVARTLGYKFVLKSAEVTDEIVPGESFTLSLELENEGFGNLMKAKDLEVVLKKGTETLTARVDEDARFWDDESGAIEKAFTFSVPQDMAPGEWTMYLGLTSTFDTLKANPAYSVRFANVGVWDAESGLNKLGEITISASGAPGSAERFEQIDAEGGGQGGSDDEPPADGGGSGDVDGDGITTISDAVALIAALLNGQELTGAQFAAADMDGDGHLTMSDAMWIVQKVLL